MKNYKTKSPVLFLIFNRPDTTITVFNAIKEARPAKLYIAADGPRAERPGEDIRCKETLSIVENIDWDCEVKRLYRENNLGCKNAVSGAIDWFFENEEEGIILEDDCLPAKSFFYYCDTVLEKYRDDTRIRHITGSDMQRGKKWGEASTYFANQTHVWGWATWKRVWKDYDKDLKIYQQDEVEEKLKQLFTDQFLIGDWTNIFRELKAGKIDTWDYQLALINYFNNGLSVNPNVNLISNIGFRADATHTLSPESPYSNMPLEEISEITYPKYILPEKDADYAVFSLALNLEERWKKHNLLRRRFKRWLKALFK